MMRMKNPFWIKKDKSQTDRDSQKNTFSDFRSWVFDDIDEAVVLIHPDGSLYQVNEAFLQLHRMTKEEAEQFVQSPADFYRFYDFGFNELPPEKIPIKRVLRGELIRKMDIIAEGKTKDHRFYARIKGKPVYDANRKIIMVVFYVKDVSS